MDNFPFDNIIIVLLFSISMMLIVIDCFLLCGHFFLLGWIPIDFGFKGLDEIDSMKQILCLHNAM